MFSGLLTYTIERLSSLEFFYNTQCEQIKEQVKEGIKLFGKSALIDNYLRFKSCPDKALYESEEFKELEEKAQKYVKISDFKDEENTLFFSLIPSDDANVPKNKKEMLNGAASFRKYQEMPAIHGSNTLILLITRFEDFVSNYLSVLYRKYPQKYLNSQSILFSEIIDCGLEEVREKIIMREVDLKMRESYTEWFKLFESHGMKFDNCKQELKALREMYARRNIWVHNNGEVNSSYLGMVKDTSAKINDTMYVSKTYMEHAFVTIKTIVMTIMIETIRIIDKKSKNDFVEEIFSTAYDMLVNQEYQVCKKAFSQLQNNKNAKFDTQLASRINYWISIKHLDGIKQIKQDVEAFDVSALNMMFEVAKEALLDNFGTVSKMLDYMIEKGEIRADVIENFPLFIEYRESEDYSKLRDDHTEFFGLSSVEIDANDCCYEDDSANDVIEGELCTV